LRSIRPPPPDAVFRINDILLHGLAFTYLTFALGLAHRYPHWFAPAAWMLAYGVLVEVVQSLEPERSVGFKDVTVDIVGIFLGLALTRWLGPWVGEVGDRLSAATATSLHGGGQAMSVRGSAGGGMGPDC
jgi:hypothetical protein